VLGDLSVAFMQSEEDAQRISALGLVDERIQSVGNMKFDKRTPRQLRTMWTFEVGRRYGLNSDSADNHLPPRHALARRDWS